MKKRVVFILTVLLVFCSCRKTVNVVSYNVGVFSKYGENSTADVAAVLQDLDADVVGLCELDSCTVRTGGVFQIEELRALMPSGWQAFFAKALDFQGGAYGIGILLSPEYEVSDHYTVNLPKAGGTENRVACVVETADFVYAVTHLEHTSKAARMAQIRVLDSLLVSSYAFSGKPVVLSGDFNSVPESDEIAFMSRNWSRVSPSDFTYSTDAPRVCIDYVFLLRKDAGTPRCIRCDVVDNALTRRASDHFPVSAEIAY